MPDIGDIFDLPNPPTTPVVIQWRGLLVFLCMTVALMAFWPVDEMIFPTRKAPSQASLIQAENFSTASQQLLHGQIPLFTSTPRFGQPLLERGNLGIFSTNILPYLVGDSRRIWVAAIIIQLMAGCIGMWILASWVFIIPINRTLAASLYWPVILTMYRHDLVIVGYAAAMPWCMISVRWLMEKKSPMRFSLASLALANQFLFGNANLSLIILLATFIFIAPILNFRKPIRLLMDLLLFLALALFSFAMAGVQWIPMLHNPAMRSALLHDLGLATSYLPAAILLLGLNVALFIPYLLAKKKMLPIGRLTITTTIIGIAILLHLLALVDHLDSRYMHSRKRTPALKVAVNSMATTRPAAIADIPFNDYNTTSVWTTRKVRWNTAATLPTDIAKTLLVEFSEDFSADTKLWLDDLFPDRKTAKSPTPESFFSTIPRIETVDQIGGRIRIVTKTSGVGWLIVPVAYRDGWIASSKATGIYGQFAVTRHHPVVPAKLISTDSSQQQFPAIPLEIGIPSEVILEYRPVSFKRGLLLTSLSGVLLLLVMIWPMTKL